METVFLKILNMSITAGWLVLAVLLLRPLLKKAPRYWSVISWALVGIRLVLPFSFQSALSLIPSTETVPADILYDTTPQIQTGLDALNSTVNPVISQSLTPNPGDSVNPMQILVWLGAAVWLLGMAAMSLYTLISYGRLRRKVREAAPLRENIWICDRIETPFILGIFRPRIYLPSAMEQADIPYVLAHEQAHLQRKDHLWKPLGFLLLTVYWFNPLLWVAYILLCRDIEAACDEKVLENMGQEAKKPYSHALINCSVPRKMIAACPLAFGETNIKNRVKNVLNYKKPAFWLLIAAVVICVVLSVCFLTNPTSVNAKMQVFLDCQIAEHHQSDHSAGNACVLDYEILGVKKKGNEITVYMWVLYEEYTMENGKMEQGSGAHSPTVVTAEKADGNYQLIEYWTPRDGSYYPDDIREKFPLYLWPKALDSQRYIDRQQKACQKLAEEYFAENPSSGGTSWDQDSLEKLRRLEKEYPRYFKNLEKTGMTVYVWQMAAGSYSWGLLPDYEYYSWDKSEDLVRLSLDELHAIVDAYGLTPEQVTVTPIQLLHSSYAYNIDDAYRENVRTLFWQWRTTDITVENGALIDSSQLDIDGDGIRETCTLHYGPTSGIFTFILSAYQDGNLEYRNIFTANHGQLRFAVLEDGSAGLSLQRNYGGDGPELYRIVVADGNLSLLDETLTSVVLYWGPQGVTSAPEEYAYYPIIESVAAEYTVSYAGGGQEAGIFEEAVNKNTFYLSSQVHLPVIVLDTRQALEDFCWNYVNVTSTSAEASFQTVAGQYDEAFFRDHTLVLVYVPCGNCTHRFDVAQVHKTGDNLTVRVVETTGAEVVADAEACWLIAIPITKSMAGSLTSYDAVLVDP